ncbi:unnamed protein product [Symbiodinium sp. CCMP2456]|nr:unnamed protein product [Symbiodinium sp. CCMP2456]
MVRLAANVQQMRSASLQSTRMQAALRAPTWGVSPSAAHPRSCVCHPATWWTSIATWPAISPLGIGAPMRWPAAGATSMPAASLASARRSWFPCAKRAMLAPGARAALKATHVQMQTFCGASPAPTGPLHQSRPGGVVCQLLSLEEPGPLRVGGCQCRCLRV